MPHSSGTLFDIGIFQSHQRNTASLCPASAGMNRSTHQPYRPARAVPRVCGDEPVQCDVPKEAFTCAPRLRG